MSQAKIDRLRKILALTASEEDGEALLALRRAMKALADMGLELEDFATESIILAAQTHAEIGEKPICTPIVSNGIPSIAVRRSAPAEVFELPASAANDLERITKRFREVLNASDGSNSTRFTMKATDGKAQIYAELSGYKPFEIWTGPSADASKIVSGLRRGYMHAFK